MSKTIGKADVQLADLARKIIKHKALTGKSLSKRLDSLGFSEEDIREQKDYLHAKDIYAEHMDREVLERVKKGAQKSSRKNWKVICAEMQGLTQVRL